MMAYRKILLGVLVLLAIGGAWSYRYFSIKPIGNLCRNDVLQIRHATYQAEFAQMKPQSKSPWVRLRQLPLTLKCRFQTRILGITQESDGSVTVQSVSGLWGKRNHRLEKKGDKWFYKGEKIKNPNVIIL